MGSVRKLRNPLRRWACLTPSVTRSRRAFWRRAAMTSGLAVRSALRDGISDALSCELSRDSTGSRRPAHLYAKGRPQPDPLCSLSPPGPRYTATSHGRLGATPPELARDRIVVRRRDQALRCT